MDLWIRSQDKKILVPLKDKIEIIEFGNVDINVHLTDLIYNGYSLGYYNNERALEILDEIQERLYDLQLYSSDPTTYNILYEHSEELCVYEMPKE